MYYSSGTEPNMYTNGRVQNGWPTNDEQSVYYGRPSYHQPESESSQRLAFLYDRPYTAAPVTTTQPISQNGARCDVDNDAPPPLPTSLPPSCVEYQPMSRAMPAPMFQHNTLPSASPVSPTNIGHQMTRLDINDMHLPPAPGGATTARHRDVTGRTRTLPVSYARRQSAPGPCLPPNSNAKKQWSITPCGFTNSKGQMHTSSSSSDARNGLYTPQTATTTVDGPKLLVSDCSRRNRSFGSQESFLDSDNSRHSSAIDNSSIRYNLREGDEIGDYEQTSIRYTGKANPSKIFRLLQTATGSDTETDMKMAQAAMRQQVRRRRPTQEEHEDQLHEPNSDDIVDISYVGSNIPSRTFRCLQEAIGARDPQVDDMSNSNQQGRSVRIVHLRPSIKKHSSMDNILSCSDL